MLNSLLDLDWNSKHFYIKVDIAVLECTAVISFCILNHVLSINLLPFSAGYFSAWMLVQHLLVVSYILKCDMNIMLYDKLDNTGSAERRGSLKLVSFWMKHCTECVKMHHANSLQTKNVFSNMFLERLSLYDNELDIQARWLFGFYIVYCQLEVGCVTMHMLLCITTECLIGLDLVLENESLKF